MSEQVAFSYSGVCSPVRQVTSHDVEPDSAIGPVRHTVPPRSREKTKPAAYVCITCSDARVQHIIAAARTEPCQTIGCGDRTSRTASSRRSSTMDSDNY